MRWLFLLVLLVPMPVLAHPVTLAYMDIRPATSEEPLRLTVAIHPHQALLLVGLPHNDDHEEGGFGHQIPDLKDHAPLIAAYLSSHTQVSAQGTPCTWEPTRVDIPDTELGALADGISMTAPLVCEGAPEALEVSSTIFIDTFPQQQTVVRLELPEGFADRMMLDRHTTQGTVDLTSAPEKDNRIQWIGWMVLLFAVSGIGGLIYRMNIASPKE